MSTDGDFSNENPFASPQSDINPFVANIGEAEQLRLEHLSHEASIKSMGFLYYLGGFLLLLYFIGSSVGFVLTLVAGADLEFLLPLLFIVLLTGFFTWLNFWVAHGLRRLNPKVHTVATILSAFGLLAIPIGTIINGYFLWLLQSKKGKFIMSPGYRDIVNETPHIKYRTSIVLWVFLGVLTVLLLMAIAAAVFG